MCAKTLSDASPMLMTTPPARCLSCLLKLMVAASFFCLLPNRWKVQRSISFRRRLNPSVFVNRGVDVLLAGNLQSFMDINTFASSFCQLFGTCSNARSTCSSGRTMFAGNVFWSCGDCSTAKGYYSAAFAGIITVWIKINRVMNGC